MTTAAENQNWQKRQYDSYGPHFRIETANPELGVCGNIAYNLYGYADSGDTSNLGLKGNGQFDIFADQCITIDGGAKVEGGGVCVNIIGSRGDIAITAMDNGDVRIKGRNIIIDADENIEMLAGGKVSIDSAEIEAVNQNTTRINAKRTFVSGKSIDIGGSTGVVLKTKSLSFSPTNSFEESAGEITITFLGIKISSAISNEGASPGLRTL